MYRKIHTEETRNVALAEKVPAVDLDRLTAYRESGRFFELLDELGLSLAVSREYEHFLVFLGVLDGEPVQTAMEIPHPSGMCLDPGTGRIVVSSTRTPHQFFWLQPFDPESPRSEIIPEQYLPDRGATYVPYKSLILPGGLYVHDLAMVNGDLYANVTGHNFIARIDPDGGWERVWWPACLDSLGREAFARNCLQLNSIGADRSLETGFFTAFSDQTHGPKPWKEGYGPDGKGVLFDGRTRAPILRGLTCPHSARIHQGKVWLCDSGYGRVGLADFSKTNGGPASVRFETVLRLPGFTRGLSFYGHHAFVGLSRVIDFYEPYAPGLKPAETLCGVAAFDLRTGEETGRLVWPEGYQVYEVLALPGVRTARLPVKRPGDEFNQALRYLG